MDFQNRGTQQHSQVAAAQTASGAPGMVGSTGKHRGRDKGSLDKWVRIFTVVLLFSVTIIAIGVLISLYNGGNQEGKIVNTNGFQAVDVNIAGTSATDQVYFGHIKSITSKYLEIEDVYYIPTSSTGTNLTLQPLVCQFDSPYNQVIINTQNLTWWENLQSTSTVTKTITSYEKANPKGPTCPTNSSSASTSSTSSSTTGTGTATTPTTTTPTNTKP